MAIDLTALPIRRAVPTPYRLGGTVRSPVGGSQTINRLGDRWSFAFETPPMRIEPDGRLWSEAIEQAIREGGIVRVRQPDVKIGPLGNPVVAADTASGRSVPLAGMTPGGVILRGLWMTMIVDGQRYLDKITTQAIVASDGTVTVAIQNLIRAPLTEGDEVKITKPEIEGTVEGDIGGAWEANRLTSFSFTVTEDA